MSDLPANSATSAIGSCDLETIRLAEIGSLVSSTVRFLAIVAAIKHFTIETHYRSIDLIHTAITDLRFGRPPSVIFGRLDDAVTVDLHITYALDREPMGAALDEGRCVFAMSGARGSTPGRWSGRLDRGSR